MTLPFVLLGILMQPLQSPSPPSGEAVSRSTKIRKELLSTHSGTDPAITNAAERQRRFSTLASLVRGEMLRQLQAGIRTPEDLLAALLPLCRTDWEEPVTVLHKEQAGADVFFVAYSIVWGPSALPHAKAILDAFRYEGGKAEFVATIGDNLDDTLVRAQLLQSPLSNQIWLLVHGQQTGVMQYTEKARILAFDGAAFTEIWAPPPMGSPVYTINGPRVQITYEALPQRVNRGVVQTLLLTPSGVLEIEPLPQNEHH